MKRIKVKVYGTVQGVFYRKSTQAKARELQLDGWVRNNADGSVELEAQGEEKKLEELAEWCKQGPSAASVERIEVSDTEPKGNEKGFQLIRN